MKNKIVLTGLGLLVFIFCTVDFSRAAMDSRCNINYLSTPNEHPWQHDDSPRLPDGLNRTLSFAVILPACPTIKAILIFHTLGVPPVPAKGLQRATIFSRKNEQHFNGER